jgi:molybdopterin molybdotransferase
LLIKKGKRIGAAEIAVLASVGKAQVPVWKLPRVAVISTGDELVDVSETPEIQQIRRSNSYMLAAALTQIQAHVQLFHLPDDPEVLETQLQQLLQEFEVLVLSGGVSEGKADFVPSILEKLGVEKIFHKVAQRPGKPFWFGKSPRNLVFALPGNPVSTFLCCYRYVLPSVGQGTFQTEQVALAEDLRFDPALTYYLPVRLHHDWQGRRLATPLRGSGSGDLANLLEADGFLELPPEICEFNAGEVYDFIRFRY